MRTAEATDWMYGSPDPRRHGLAAFLAVVFSLLFHTVVLLRLPAIQMLHPDVDAAAPERVRPPFRIEDVRTAPLDPVPETPDRLLSEARMADVFQPAPPRVEDHAPAHVPLAFTDPGLPDIEGEHGALATPAPPADPAPRHARIQQVEITRTVVPDLVAALPRRVTPRIERALEAPDITLPTDPFLLAALHADSSDPSTPDPEFGAGIADRGGAGMPTDAEPGLRDRRRAEAAADRILRGLERPRAVESIDRHLDFHVRLFRPADEREYQYFRIDIVRAGPDALPVLPRDLLLVQDCSESMTQPLIEECKRGLRTLVQTLAPKDRFEIVAFRETQDPCFGQWTPATATARARAQWFIEQLEARGRTDVNASLETLLDMPRTPGRPIMAVYVTDGIPTTGVLDQSSILERFTRANAGTISFFPFGAGARINRFLLDFLGFQNRGSAFFVDSFNAVPAGLQQLAQEIRRPVLSDLTYRVSGLPADAVYPQTLTHLFLDRPLTLFGRAPVDGETAALRILGRSQDRRHDIVHALEWERAEAGDSEIRAQWALQKAYHLIGEHAATGDPAILERLRALSRRTGIRTPYAEALPDFRPRP